MKPAIEGPWTVGGKDGCTIVDQYGRSIANGGNNRAVQGAELMRCLQLAAAAPELLAALEQIERVARSKGMTAADRAAALRDICHHASAAIATASGGEQ